MLSLDTYIPKQRSINPTSEVKLRIGEQIKEDVTKCLSTICYILFLWDYIVNAYI